MNGRLTTLWVLVRKDLAIEGRAREALPAMVVGGLLFVAMLAMGGGVGRSVEGVASALWAGCLVSCVLGVERGMAIERQGGALAGVLLTPVDRGTVFLAKLVSNLVLLGISSLIVSLLGMGLFGLSLGGGVWGFAGAMGLGLIGLAAVGTLFAATLGGSAGRRGLLVLLVLPLCIPVVVASIRVSVLLATDGGGPGLGVLLAFDVVYVVAGWLAFECAVDV